METIQTVDSLNKQYRIYLEIRYCKLHLEELLLEDYVCDMYI